MIEELPRAWAPGCLSGRWGRGRRSAPHSCVSPLVANRSGWLSLPNEAPALVVCSFKFSRRGARRSSRQAARRDSGRVHRERLEHLPRPGVAGGCAREPAPPTVCLRPARVARPGVDADRRRAARRQPRLSGSAAARSGSVRSRWLHVQHVVDAQAPVTDGDEQAWSEAEMA